MKLRNTWGKRINKNQNKTEYLPVNMHVSGEPTQIPASQYNVKSPKSRSYPYWQLYVAVDPRVVLSKSTITPIEIGGLRQSETNVKKPNYYKFTIEYPIQWLS